MFKSMRFSRWAQPVVSRRWAFVTVAVETVSRLSGYRLLCHQKHVAWQRACGIA